MKKTKKVVKKAKKPKKTKTFYECTEVYAGAPHEPDVRRFSTFEKAFAHAKKAINEMAEGNSEAISIEVYSTPEKGARLSIYDTTITIELVDIE